MKKIFTLVLVLLSLTVFSQNKKNVNHILLIDKTESLTGKGDGGGQNIWSEVKKAVNDYIKDVKTGDKITIYHFSNMLSDPKVFIIKSENDKTAARSYVDKIDASGRNTCLYNSLNEILDIWDNSKYNIWMGIYTDGHDNCGTIQFKDIIEKFKLKKGDDDYVYYITIGKDAPAEVKNQDVITVRDRVTPGNIQKQVDKVIAEHQAEQQRIEAEKLEKEKKKQDSIQTAIIEKQKKDCNDKGGIWDCDKNNNCQCTMPLTIIDYILIVLGILIVLLLIWLLLLKKKIFPTMTGRLLFDQDIDVNLRGSYRFVLYTTAQMPSCAKPGFFKNILCGKTGSFRIPATPETLVHNDNFIEIKPVKKRNKYLNSLKTNGNLEVESEYKILYHGLKYKILDKNIQQDFTYFIYDNEKHSISY